MDWVPVIFMFVAVSTSPGVSRSTGAPAQACRNLMPQHERNVNQTSSAPFELDVSPFRDPGIPRADGSVFFTYSYVSGVSYNLVFKTRRGFNSSDFRGFFAQARLVANDSNVGGFLSPGVDDLYRLSSCSTPTFGVTHRDSSEKSKVTVQWTSPPTDTGAISFRYTIVQDFNTFWSSLMTVPIIERRCSVRTGRLYYHSPTNQCLQQCPPGFVGSYATGICREFVDHYPISFTVDVQYLVWNYNLLVENATVLEYTLMLTRSLSSNLYYFSINLYSTKLNESHFRFSNGGTHMFVSRDDFEVLRNNLKFYRVRVHIIDVVNFNTTEGDFNIAANLFDRLTRVEGFALGQTVFHFETGPCLNYSPCINGGTCDDNYGRSIRYKCTCLPDTTGINCSEIINDCVTPNAIDCNHGVCMDGNQTFFCLCDPGFTGDRCETDVDECAAMNCISGVCTDLINDYNCSCYTGWEGRNCDSRINYCVGDPLHGPCMAAGGVRCDNKNSTFECVCLIGFTGSLCEIDIDDCVPDNPCHNGGNCVDLPFAAVQCVCPSNSSGPFCEVPLMPCDPLPCSNNGSCTDLGWGNYNCSCPNGFSGMNCEVDIDVCTSATCLNGGICTEGVGASYSCMCMPGHTGAHCEEEILFCRNNTCFNGGECMEEPGVHVSCNCLTGYTGDACEVDMDFCTQQSCMNEGVCIEGVGIETSCSCSFGFSGNNCENDLDFCHVRQCYNRGTCVEGLGAAISCICENGFEGSLCEIDIDIFCTDSTCSYNGECVEGYGDSISCMCNPRYSGNNCEVDKCEFFTCLNGGTCIESSDSGVACRCSGGFEGTNCERNVLPTSPSTTSCENEQCQNGGMCRDDAGTLVCVCLHPWSGSTCEECTLPNCKYCNYNTTENATKCLQCIGGYYLDSNTNCICSIINCMHCSEDGEICNTCKNKFELSSNKSSCIQIPTKFNPLGVVVAVMAVVLGTVLAVMVSLVLYFCIFNKKQVSKEKPDTDECAPNPSYFDVKLKDIVKKDVGYQDAMYY